MFYSTIVYKLPKGVREASRATGIPHATMSRIKRGYSIDNSTLAKLMAWAGTAQVTFTLNDLTPKEPTP